MSDQPTLCEDCQTPMADAGAIGLYCPNKQCTQPSLRVLFKMCYHDPFKNNTLTYLNGAIKCTVCNKELNIKYE